MSNTLNALVRQVVDALYLADPTLAVNVGRVDLETQLQTAVDRVMSNRVTLDTTRPDAESILLQLVQSLQAADSWRDVVHSATGQTLLRNASAGISAAMFGTARALQETHSRTSVAKSSVYASADRLGVTLRRRVAQRIRVELRIPDHTGVFQVPRFTPFVIANQNYFLREAVTFTEFELTKTVELVQGTLFELSGFALGINYERIEIGYQNYLIGTDDVYVFVDGREWPRFSDEIWQADPRARVWFEHTLENGNVEVKFGNNAYGSRVPKGASITLRWAETQGRSAVIVPADTTFVYDKLSLNVVGRVLTGYVQGDDELELDAYRELAPAMAAGRGNGIRRSDLRVNALRYPNIVDALFRGQAEIAPTKRSWTNVIQTTLLTRTGESLTNAQWADFVDYIKSQSQESWQFFRRDAIVIPLVVTADLYCRSLANLNECKSKFENAVLERFAPRRGALGYSVFANDITDVRNSVAYLADNVEYIDDLKFSYPSNFDPSVLPAGEGIVDNGEVAAGTYSCVVVRSVTVTTDYTTRRTYQGRKEIA